MAMNQQHEAMDELRDRLLRFRADRHPVEHATAQFHLGALLLQQARPEEAAQSLAVAADLFDQHGDSLSHAKSVNLLGVAWRDIGAVAEAAEAFRFAAGAFADHGQTLEEAAAHHNLGLTCVDVGDPRAAADWFSRAVDAFASAEAPGPASAAARELGAAWLSAQEPGAATEALERAVTLARDGADQAALGDAANALGCAYLAADRADEAVKALTDAAEAHPRGVRPEPHAMAKANLALAYEQAGDAPRARLAARQARAVPAAAEPVVAQADGVLARLGESHEDLLIVLDAEPPDRWAGRLRAELARWLDEPSSVRRADANAWVAGQLARDGRGPELAEAWLGVALELAPEQMETLLDALVGALHDRGAADRERFRAHLARALPRFHPPQWLRLTDTLNRLSAERGEEAVWG